MARFPIPEQAFGRAPASVKPTEADKAYAAGFFDGEGHITIAPNHHAIKTRSTIYNMRIGASQNDAAPLFWLRARWGGSVRATKRKTIASNTTYVWGCFSRGAARFLRDIRPHLLVKAARADLALAFQASLFNSGARGHTSEYRERQASMHAQLAAMNTHRPVEARA